jgi:hypothetical protein
MAPPVASVDPVEDAVVSFDYDDDAPITPLPRWLYTGKRFFLESVKLQFFLASISSHEVPNLN